MIVLTHETPILLCVAPSGFRRGIDGLVGICRNELLQHPDEGTVFVFINRAHTMIRALCHDNGGYWLMTKRISRGRFQGWPDGDHAISNASARELRLILDGVSANDPDAKKSRRVHHWHTSFVSSSGTHRSKVQDGTIEDIYPIRYWPAEKVGDHLEFALKYDGVNLGLLARIFEMVSLQAALLSQQLPFLLMLPMNSFVASKRRYCLLAYCEPRPERQISPTPSCLFQIAIVSAPQTSGDFIRELMLQPIII